MNDFIDKRSFPRRKLDLSFDLVLNGDVVPAVVTDYSLNGMAILIKGKSDLDAQVLDLHIRDISLNTTGRVIWTREMLAGIKVGVSSMGPLEGMLEYYQLSDVLRGVRRAGKTGALQIEADQFLKKIYFKEGEMVFSSSDQEQEQLGAMLVAAGRITSQQYQDAIAVARETGKSQGAALVEMRLLAPQELVEAVHRRVEAVITNLCNIGNARFYFSEEPLARGEIVMLKLNSNDLLYRGAKKTDCIEIFKKQYLNHPVKVSVSSEAHRILERMVLEKQDRETLSIITGMISLDEILSMSPFKKEETLKSIYSLFSAHLLDLEAERIQEEMPQEPETVLETDAIAPDQVDKIDELYREYKTLGYHGILGLIPNASSADIKRAYHAMAKEYHPDRYLHVQDEEFRGKLNAVFAYINEAYRALSKSGSVSQQDSRDPEQKSSGMNNREMAQEKYRQGRNSLNNQDDENAMTFFGQAVYLDDSEPDYHYYYGIALLRNRKIKDAEASIRKALHFSPHNADYFAELGHIYLKLGFMTRAKNTFDKALSLRPSQARAVEGLNTILQRQKD